MKKRSAAGSGLRSAGFRAGLIDALPFAPGVGLLGAIFGASAGPAGIGPASAVGMSVIVWSGAGQFAAVPLWRQGAWVVALTAFALSLRFALMTASMAPRLAEARVPRGWRALLAFCVTDESYALAMTRRGGRLEPEYLLGAWVPLYAPWVGGTLVGVALGARVPAGWRGPLEAVFPIVFLTLTVLVCTTRTATLVALLGGALSVAGALLLPPGWNVVAAGILASLAGPWLERRRGGLAGTGVSGGGGSAGAGRGEPGASTRGGGAMGGRAGTGADDRGERQRVRGDVGAAGR